MKKLVLKLRVKSISNNSLDSVLDSNSRIDSALNYIKGRILEADNEDIFSIDNCQFSYSHIDFTTDKEGNRYVEITSDSVTDAVYYYITGEYRSNSTIQAFCSNCKHLIMECYIENYDATNIGDRKNKGQSYKYKITLHMDSANDSIILYNLLCRKHLEYIIDYNFREVSLSTKITLLSGNVEKPEFSEDCSELSFIASYNIKLDNYSGDADISVYNDSYESAPIGGYKNIQMLCNLIEENTKESSITEIANISVKLKYNFHRMKMDEEVIRDPYAAMELINKITDKKFTIAGYTAILKNINMDINNYDKILTINIDCRMIYHNAEKFYSYFRHFPCKLLDYPKVLLKFLDNINFTVECSLNPMSLVMSVDQEVVEKKVEEKKPMEDSREYMIKFVTNGASLDDAKLKNILKNGISFIIAKSGKNLLDIKSDMISYYSIDDREFKIFITIPYSFTSIILGEGMAQSSVSIIAYNEEAPIFTIIENIVCVIKEINRKAEEKPMETITTNTLTVDLKGVNKNYTKLDIDTIKFASGLRIDKTIIKAIYDQVKSVIFNEPFTKVIWKDGSVTKVSSGKEKYDKDYGVALCILKKMLGNTSNYYDLVKDLIKLGDKQEKARTEAKALKEAKKLAAKRKKQKEEIKNHHFEDLEYDTIPSTVPEDVESNNEDNN